MPPQLTWLLVAYGVSFWGTCIASGVIAWVAITEAGVDGTQLGVLLGVAAMVSAVASLGVSSWMARVPPKVMIIGLNIVCAATMLGLAAHVWLHQPNIWVLITAAAIEAGVGILQGGAVAALLKATAGQHLQQGSARLETIFWSGNAGGQILGGFITAQLGGATTIAINGASFLVAAALFTHLRAHRRKPQQDPAPVTTKPNTAPKVTPPGETSTTPGVLAGFAVIARHRQLWALFRCSVLFGGGVAAATAMLPLLVANRLGLSAASLGLILGVPCLAGVTGGLLSPRIANRFGQFRTLQFFGLARTLPLIGMALVLPGPYAATILVAANAVVLFAMAVFNTQFAVARITMTPDESLTTVVTSWGAAARFSQPLFILGAGVCAGTFGIQAAFAAAAAVAIVSSVFLIGLRSPATNQAAP